MTIASGGVLPKIHPELLARKKGGKFPGLGSPPSPILAPPPAKKAKAAPAKATPPKPSIAKKQVPSLGARGGKGKAQAKVGRATNILDY